jgi:hypothetical protein
MKTLLWAILFSTNAAMASTGLSMLYPDYSGYNPMFYPNYSYNDCIACNYYSQSSMPMNNYNAFNSGYNSPWWNQYGSMSYPNYSYPAAWSNSGVNSSMYSGHGHGFAGKPNVYVTAPDKTELHVTVSGVEEGNLLLTVPAYGEDGWHATVNKNKFVVESTNHDYLFYDVRFDENTFSDEKGFCGNRKVVIEGMMSTLQALTFKSEEIKDFYEYWSIKLPRSNSYCVFPQLNEENDKAYKLSVSEKSKKDITVTRVTFLVNFEEKLKDKLPAKFRHPPTDVKKLQERVKSITSVKPHPIHVREWGVAFLSGDK